MSRVCIDYVWYVEFLEDDDRLVELSPYARARFVGKLLNDIA